MWLKSPLISTLHGFSTRKGGVSPEPYHSLNLAGKEDDPDTIRKNREIALDDLGLSIENLSLLHQVHGTEVVLAKPGTQTADGQVTSTKGVILTVNAADCYPILFHDEVAGVIGAAHAGWRGTVAKIAEAVIKKMVALGATAESIKAAIGPGISRERFEVGPEVTEAFRNAGFPDTVFQLKGHIDLVEANRHVLIQTGVHPEHIHCLNRCTYEPEFFSYRRDKGITGRMWGLITLP